jgi:hypothetical protein
MTLMYYTFRVGCAIAQAVSCWLPTMVAWVGSCGICGGQSGTGAGFLQVLSFPCQFAFPMLHNHHPSSGAGTIGWTVAAVPSGFSLTPWGGTNTFRVVDYMPSDFLYTHSNTSVCLETLLEIILQKSFQYCHYIALSLQVNLSRKFLVLWI